MISHQKTNEASVQWTQQEIRTYRRKLSPIEDAVQWQEQNTELILEWINRNRGSARKILMPHETDQIFKLRIETESGFVYANVGDFIVRGEYGFKPCDADEFRMTRQPIDA